MNQYQLELLKQHLVSIKFSFSEINRIIETQFTDYLNTEDTQWIEQIKLVFLNIESNISKIEAK